MKLGDLILSRRNQRGMAMRDVAAAAKMSASGVHALEKSINVDPKVSTVLGLAKALKLRPEIVFAAARETLEGKPDAAVPPEGDQ